jgi:glycosyltransferase involved in cell wall biosynthesis
MRVLYLYMFPLWGNGSGTWLRRLVHHTSLNYRNFKAAIIAPETRQFIDAKMYRAKPPHMGVFVGNPELPGIKRYVDLTNKQHFEVYEYYLNLTIRAIEEFKPDLIHVFHTAFLPAVTKVIADMYHIPYIISTHGSDLYYLKEDKRWIKQVRDASPKAKFITANSNFTRDWYLQIFGRHLAKQTRTIPAGVDNNIDFGRDVSWIDKKYGFKYDKMVLFTGRLTKHKGVDYLIKAARLIKAEIVILGDGPERHYLESLITKYKLTNVHLLGYFSQRLGQINDFYLRANVYVAPSVWDEPLGLVILEAMVHKTPVIVTRKGGVTTIVQDGLNGFLVRPKSAPVIAENVNKLLADEKLAKKMGEYAYKTVLHKFNWERIASKFYSLYQNATKKPVSKKEPPDSIIYATIKKLRTGEPLPDPPLMETSAPRKSK